MKNILLYIAISSVVLAASCKKKGCIDSEAVNYNTEAKKDDGSCSFNHKGEAVIWLNNNLAGQFAQDSVYFLKVYINNENIGAIQTLNASWTSAPECGAAEAVTLNQELGESESGSFDYIVKDEDDVQHFSGQIEINKNSCTSVELKL